MTETIRIGNIGKLWMPVPREWDGIGLSNVEMISISPPPDDLYEDTQGNLIAFWDVGYRGSTDYSVAFELDVAPIEYEVDPNMIGEYDNANWEYQRYTQPSEGIQSSDDSIIQLAHQIVGSETNPYRQAREVHRWVATNIQGGDMADALTTLERRAAGCGGHSRLFVALLRALGVPARNVGGFHTGYQGHFTDGNPRDGTLYIHIWSEFYLPGYGWIQSDTSAGPQNFAEINEPRIVMFRGEDIELGHGYPLGTAPWFHTPQRDVLDASYPPTQTWGDSLTLTVK